VENVSAIVSCACRGVFGSAGDDGVDGALACDWQKRRCRT